VLDLEEVGDRGLDLLLEDVSRAYPRVAENTYEGKP